jgi:hypothetical protein
MTDAFAMKCQAHWKEVHAVEMSGPNGQPLQAPPTLQIVPPSNSRNDDLAAKGIYPPSTAEGSNSAG